MQVPERIVDRFDTDDCRPSADARCGFMSACCSATDVPHHFDCKLPDCTCPCHAAENGSHLGGLSLISQAVISRSSHQSTTNARLTDSVVEVQLCDDKEVPLSFADLPNVGTLRLDRALESAVQVSWNDLMSVAESGSIHLEYRIESDGSLQYLKIWASTRRGYWNLVCEQWITSAWLHSPGLHFFDGYYSEGLAHFLEIVARHQGTFIGVSGTCRCGSLHTSQPTEDESREARRLIADFISALGSSPVEQLVAAWTEALTDEVAAGGDAMTI